MEITFMSIIDFLLKWSIPIACFILIIYGVWNTYFRDPTKTSTEKLIKLMRDYYKWYLEGKTFPVKQAAKVEAELDRRGVDKRAWKDNSFDRNVKVVQGKSENYNITNPGPVKHKPKPITKTEEERTEDDKKAFDNPDYFIDVVGRR